MSTEKAFVAGSEFPPLTPGKLRLYSMRWCPYAQRALLVLAHKNIEYETVNIHLKQKPEWYLSVNPLGTVPAIQKGDVTVYESLVVADYLDETFPGNKLTPNDPYRRARDSMLIARFAKVISSFYKIFFSNQCDEEKAENVYAGLDILEAELKERKSNFCGGDSPMMIDFMLWPYMERIDVLTTMFPNLEISAKRHGLVRDYVARMKQVPAVKKAAFPLKQYMPVIMKAIEEKSPILSSIYDIGLEK